MEINAQLKYAHIAPRKMRLVIDMVKGRDVTEAELVLGNLIKRGAAPVLKLLKSAKANASNNFQLDESGLYVKDIRVNAGPVTKRMMPRAFGRGATIRKRMSHVALVLEQRDGAAVPAKKRKENQPVVRNALAEDLKSDMTDQEKGEGRTLSKKKVRRTGRFTPRIFQRKAI
ncbi:MAG: 50S ribosomal protein L22 [Candidatus Sungbacteria bacterium]|nr:50S ribosomal protein L22 [Candidatus Sungbacteria bacterium]